MKKTVICSVDGIPDRVYLCNDGEQAEKIKRVLRHLAIFDRIDVLDIKPITTLRWI